MKKAFCDNISMILFKQIHYITEKGSIGSAYMILVMPFPQKPHVVVCELHSAYYTERQFISVYIRCTFLNNVIWRSTKYFYKLRTNVAILYGTYFLEGLYNCMFDISAKTLKNVCSFLLKCSLVHQSGT